MTDRGLEQGGAVARALGGEIPPKLAAHVNSPGARFRLERAEPTYRAGRQGPGPFCVGEMKGSRRQSAVVSLPLALAAGLVGVEDHRQAFVAGLGGQMVDS